MNKRIVILGAGESGTGAAILAQKLGYEVFVSDSGSIKPEIKEIYNKKKINWEEGSHTLSNLVEAIEIIKSPGIPDDAKIIKQIKEHGVPVISEIEFAGRHTTAKTICVTGSNGKTTTANLVYHLLTKAGIKAELAGNVGNSFALKVAETKPDYFVLELSSFQLDGMFNFKAHIAILTNITPDHLDRYEHSMEKYVASKFRITRNQTSENILIYCSDDPETQKGIKKFSPCAQLLPFSIIQQGDQAGYLDNETIYIQHNKLQLTMSIYDLALKGKHNIYNSMAAAIAGQVLNIRKETIRESLSDFQGVEHRLEPVIKVHGINFINDSKATNVNSTWYALESMTTRVILIMGGIDKGNDYSSLYSLVDEKVKAIICLGKENDKLIRAFKGRVPSIVESDSMEGAVKKAYVLGSKGDTVLLSPACASFDLFENYEDRGRQYKRAVRDL